MQANIQAGEEVTRQKLRRVENFRWELDDYPELQRLHYGFVDAHRDLNLAIQRRKQK